METLRSNKQFRRVYREGRFAVTAHVVVHAVGNGDRRTRFGFSVAKKIGKAVKRNRVKRRLREISRKLAVKAGYDIVISARAGAEEASYDQLAGAVRSAFRRLGLIGRGSGIDGKDR